MFRADHAALAVKNLNQSREFYEYLGGEVVSRPSPHFVEILLGNLRLHLVKAQECATAPQPHAGPGIDHLCVSVDTAEQLRHVLDLLNKCPMLQSYAPFEIQESPPLGEGFLDHAEQRPPQKTLYARDPDGISLEIRCYH